eukprot:4030106-Ditylum_brightwellii.AAC.1
MTGKPFLAYIYEPTGTPKDNDMGAHSVCALWRLFFLALLHPHVVQQVYDTIHLAFAIVFITTATTAKELRPTELPQIASSTQTDPTHCTNTRHTAATHHHLRALQRKLRRQASTSTHTVAKHR